MGDSHRKEKLDATILMYCHRHFQQAQQTPFGHGLTELGDRILEGTFFEKADYELFPEIRTFIKELTHDARHNQSSSAS